ncbi:pseudouridine synthase [Candidatus Vidania fulgoroideorum]
MISKNSFKNNFFFLKYYNYLFVVITKKNKNIFLFCKKNYFFLQKLKSFIQYICYNKKYLLLYKKRKYLTYSSYNNLKKNLLSCIYNELGERIFKIPRCGIVHRLDYNTSGIIFIAKEIKTYFTIKKLFALRKVKKYYFVLFKSKKVKKYILIKNFIKRRKISKIKKNKKFKYAVTKLSMIYSNNNNNLFLCKILTGRKNQIKIHINKILNVKYNTINLHSWKINIPFLKIKSYSFLNKKLLLYLKKANVKIIL